MTYMFNFIYWKVHLRNLILLNILLAKEKEVKAWETVELSWFIASRVSS